MTHAVPQKAAALIARETLLPEGACVCAALSGGADSTALLLALRELGYRVSAFHLNHCLRGAESDRDEAFVRAADSAPRCGGVPRGGIRAGN